MKYNEIMKAIPHDIPVNEMPKVMAVFNGETKELRAFVVTTPVFIRFGYYVMTYIYPDAIESTQTYYHKGTQNDALEYTHDIYVDVTHTELNLTEFVCNLNVD